jgi:Acetyltransferase (GNAT) domain
MRVEIFNGSAGLRELAPRWRSLTSRLNFKRHHHHFEWHLALAETLDENDFVASAKYIAAFSDDNTLVAIIPFRFVRLEIGSFQLKVIRLVSDQDDSPIARDIVIEPTLARTDFLQEIVRCLADLDTNWDAILFGDVLEDSLAAVALQRVSRFPYFQTPGGAHGRMEFLSCGKEDRPFEGLSKGFKQNLRTAHNKLKSQNATFEIAQTEADLTNLLPDFLKVESSGWKGELGTSALQHSPTHTFLRLLIRHLGPKAACEIHVMLVRDQPISSIFGIVMNEIWFLFRTGYDESYHSVSPGHLIIENLLKQNSAKTEFGTFTLYNVPPWFSPWKADRTLKVYNKWAFRPSERGWKLGQKLLTMIQNGDVQYPGAPESAAPLKWYAA